MPRQHTHKQGVPSARDAVARPSRQSRNRDYRTFPDTLGKTPIVLKGKIAHATTIYVEQSAQAALRFLHGDHELLRRVFAHAKYLDRVAKRLSEMTKMLAPTPELT
jgi:hypothetical protein